MLGLRGELGAVEAVGKYRIVLPLGQGGTADVYLAVADGPSGFSKLVVVKVLRKSLASDERLPPDVPREARLAARLHHPNIVQTNEVHRGRRRAGAGDGVPRRPAAVAGDRARQAGRLHAGDAAARAGRRAGGAARGARAGRLRRHAAGRRAPRRLAPQPVRHASRAQAKVLDFGIAKLERSMVETEVGTIKGKLRYMAPEQLAGDKLDRRADVYAAGRDPVGGAGRRADVEGVVRGGDPRARAGGRSAAARDGAARRAGGAGAHLPAGAVAGARRPVCDGAAAGRRAGGGDVRAGPGGQPAARSARRWRGCSRTCAARPSAAIETKLGRASMATRSAGRDRHRRDARPAEPGAATGGGWRWRRCSASRRRRRADRRRGARGVSGAVTDGGRVRRRRPRPQRRSRRPGRAAAATTTADQPDGDVARRHGAPDEPRRPRRRRRPARPSRRRRRARR